VAQVIAPVVLVSLLLMAVGAVAAYHIWGRIKAAEQALGDPLVETQVGGQGSNRSGLTDSARRLIADFLAMRHRMVQVMEDEFAPPPG
jgi:molybdate transport system regulatory protein